MYKCNLIMENSKIKEMTGTEVLSFVPFSFNLSTVTAYRQSVDDNGDPEEYSVVYTEIGQVWCIDVPYGEFDYTMNKFKK